MAAIVARLGTRTSKGRAFSDAMRVSRIRTASETVSPIEASVFAAFAFTFSSTRMWTMLAAIITSFLLRRVYIVYIPNPSLRLEARIVGRFRLVSLRRAVARYIRRRGVLQWDSRTLRACSLA